MLRIPQLVVFCCSVVVFLRFSIAPMEQQPETLLRKSLTSEDIQQQSLSAENLLRKRPNLENLVRKSSNLKNLVQESPGNLLRKRLPDAIIIGGRKCGTRALLDFLGLHPRIKVAPFEVHFFDNQTRYHEGPNAYLEHLPAAAENDIVIEKTPSYFVRSEVPKRVKRLIPNVKLILILRNPVTRAISDYTQVAHVKSQKRKPIESFENQSIDRKGDIRINYKPIRNSLYIQHLRRWTNYFPLASIHIVDGDSFIKNPLPELRSVEKFLGLNSEIDPGWLYFNESKGFYCSRKPPNITGVCLGDTKGRPHVKVKPWFRRRLKMFFEPYNSQLFKFINKSFDWL